MICNVHLFVNKNKLSTARTRGAIAASSVDPLSYLRVRPRLDMTGNIGRSLLLLKLQYQDENAPARTISPSADVKNRHQKRANTL